MLSHHTAPRPARDQGGCDLLNLIRRLLAGEHWQPHSDLRRTRPFSSWAPLLISRKILVINHARQKYLLFPRLTRRAASSSGVAVVSAVSFALLVRVGIYQGPEEELEECDDPPEEVGDGVETPGLGLEHPAVGGNIHHPSGDCV